MFERYCTSCHQPHGKQIGAPDSQEKRKI
ncbi:MAG TPA: hypothetical protein DCZ13_06130 [Porticoccaceae bacterium]|nr:hypothetical protein [Porticoccaceae bacterium]